MESPEPLKDKVDFTPQLKYSATPNFHSEKLYFGLSEIIMKFMTFKCMAIMLLLLLCGAFVFVFGLRHEKSTMVVMIGFGFFIIGAFIFIKEACKTVIFTSGKVIRCSGVIPMSRVAALQLLKVDINKWVMDPKLVYAAYELNLVLDDGSRVNILDHGNELEMNKDAMLLARRLKCPIWTSDGELDPSPENLEACREKIRQSLGYQDRLKMYHVIRIEEHPVPFLLVALILCGSICWFVFLEPAWDWYRSRNWVKCPATVTYSKIQQRKMTSESNKKRQEYLEYNADIRAEYQWNGMIYLCSTYSFAPENWSPDKEETLRLLKKYPVGAETSCFVNPDSPQESVFVCKGEPISHVSRLMAGLMVLLCFSVIFIAGRRLLLGPTPLDDDDDNSGDSGDGGDGGE